MQTERKKRSGIMLCYPFEEKRLERWGYPVMVQPKLDGERARLAFDAALGYCFWSSTEELVNFAVPHLLEAINRRGLPFGTHLDGELYAHGLSFEEIHSIVSRRKTIHPDHSMIEYHVFDVLIPDCPQYLRMLRLDQLSSSFPTGIKLVPTRSAHSLDEIWAINSHYLAEGYEGIVVRKPNNLYIPRRSTELMKFKPKQEDSYPVVGAVEEHDKFGSPKGSLGALICETDGDRFQVGTGFTQAQRAEIWQAYLNTPSLFESGMLCARIQYQHITSGSGKGREKGVPRFPVFVTLEETL